VGQTDNFLFSFLARNLVADTPSRHGFAAGCEAMALPRRQVATFDWAVPLVRARPTVTFALEQSFNFIETCLGFNDERLKLGQIIKGHRLCHLLTNSSRNSDSGASWSLTEN
jgi:hypothetical protein